MFKKLFKFVSLRTKLFATMALSLLIATLVFFGTSEIGDFMVWKYYLGDESRHEREIGHVKDFQNYVTSNKLSVKDTEQISSWSGGNYVDIIIYKDSTLFYAPDWFKDFNQNEGDNILGDVGIIEPPDEEENNDNVDTSVGDETDTGEIDSSEATELESSLENVENPEDEENPDDKVEETQSTEFVDKGWFSGDRGFVQYLTEEARNTYLQRLDDILEGNKELKEIYFLDGTLFVMIIDYSEEFFKSLVFAISLGVAFLVVAVLMLVSFSNTTSRIKRLAKKVRLVEKGELDLQIKAEGNDEITDLANDVNSMRNAVVDNMTREKQAWEANTELITAMSHDIRTPLTVLLGYLDIMSEQNSDPANAEYIEACKENAMRLKGLSDDMFSYFLVFGKDEGTGANLETFEASAIEHMMFEHELLLIENHFNFSHGASPEKVLVEADITLLGRVVDNLYSNIAKYADASETVKISFEIKDDKLEISITNKIKSDNDRPESNRIGLKTCERIMKKINGGFELKNDGESFNVRISLKIIKNIK